MSMKTFVWGGMFIGSSIGGILPYFWGDFGLSFSSIILSSVGAFLGIIAGYKLGKYLGA